MSKLYKGYEAGKQIFGAVKNLLKGGTQKTTGEAIKSVPVGKNLKTKRFQQDDIINTRERIMTEYGIKDPKSRVALRTKANQPKINKKIADIQDRARVKKMGFNEYKKSLRENKMGGGMMGRRFGMRSGTNPFKKETDVDKIKKTFGPKSGLKKIDPKKQKGLAKLKQERPDVVRKMGYMKRGGRA